MYFSVNDYFYLFNEIGELGMISQYYRQYLNGNLGNLESLHINLRNCSQQFTRHLDKRIGKTHRNNSTEIQNTELKQCPSVLETHFQEKINQIQDKNKEIIEKLLICQQKIEKQFSKQKGLQRNTQREFNLKDDVQSLRKKAEKLYEKVLIHQLQIQNEEKQIIQPNDDQNKSFEQESLNLIKNLYEEYQKQQKQLDKTKQLIYNLNESLLD